MKKKLIIICSVIAALAVLAFGCWMFVFSPWALSRIAYIDVEASEISKTVIHLDGSMEGVQGDAVLTERESIEKTIERLASFKVCKAIWHPPHNATGEMGTTIAIGFYRGDEHVGGVSLSKLQYRMLIFKEKRLLFADIPPAFFQEMLDLYRANAPAALPR